MSTELRHNIYITLYYPYNVIYLNYNNVKRTTRSKNMKLLV